MFTTLFKKKPLWPSLLSKVGRFCRFNIVGGLGIGVQLLTLWVLTAFGMGTLPATLMATGAAIVHNFVWHAQWTWKERALTGAAGVRAFITFIAANGLVSLVGGTAITAAAISLWQAPAVAANAIAIVVCGLVNYWLADAVAFRRLLRLPPGELET